MKLFNTSDIVIVKRCQEQFNFTLSSAALERRRTKFMHKFCYIYVVKIDFQKKTNGQ